MSDNPIITNTKESLSKTISPQSYKIIGLPGTGKTTKLISMGHFVHT